jgi:tryptophan 2,3-dioxygenase
MEPLSSDRLNYESYLKIPELLSLQQLLSTHHDEMLFIQIHQTYELWFKQIFHELGELIRCFQNKDVQRSIKVLGRIHTIQEVLIKQIDILETMTPTEFAEFRDKLRPASGFQSVQFREIEFMSGLKNPYFLKMFSDLPSPQQRLAKQMMAPTLYDHFLKMLSERGFSIPESILKRDVSQPYERNADVLSVIEQIYKTCSHYDLYMLCEALLNYDENFRLWRFRHIVMVERTIGMKSGTGGSAGAKYLASTLESRFFPELWEVRTIIGTDY